MRLWLEMNDKDLVKGLGVCKGKTQLSNTRSFPREKARFDSIGKSTRLEKCQSCVLSLRIGSDGNLPDV